MPDLVNGMYEMLGGLFILLNCWRLHKDRQLKGVSWLTITFFTTWGYWNLVFYPSYGAWFSTIGGVGVSIANTIWLVMALYLTWKERKNGGKSSSDSIGDNQRARETNPASLRI